VQAGLELGWQVREGLLPEPSHVIVALGSGGTAAGMLLGMRAAGLRSRLVCVLVNDLTRVGARRVLRLAHRTQRLLARRGATLPHVRISVADLLVRDDWLGAGYGHPTAAAGRATAAFAAQGVALDPVYTAKAAAGLMELNEHGELGPGPVLFWLTAG
jgi:D-cysteine desulfhydrase